VIQLHPDADAALSRLRPSHRLGLISDGASGPQWKKIEALGLRSRLDCLVVTSDLGPDCGKPNPRAFQLVAESLGIDHQECVYVGDNPIKDFVAPHRLGWMTVRMIREEGIYRDDHPPVDGSPQHTIRTLDDLDGLLLPQRGSL
jgi:putative hydrolase of the HAD superfamily